MTGASPDPIADVLAQDPVLDALARDAARLVFPEAVRLLGRALGGRAIGTTGKVEEERVLFRAAPSLGFAASDIAAIHADRHADTPWAAQMEVNFLGLYGPASPLAAPWTEHVLTEDEGRRANLRDFLDLFDHPLIALSYRIWRQYRLHLQAAKPQDPVVRAVLAMAGVTVGNGFDDTVLDPFRLLPLAGLLAQHSRSALTIQRILEGYFEVQVAIEEWRPRRAPIPPAQYFRLGAPQATLGHGTVIGESVPDIAGMVAVVLGPLSAVDFDAFLPGGAARRGLAALLRLAVREPLECEVELILRDDAEGGMVLGEGRLGWTSWQGGAGASRRCRTGSAWAKTGAQRADRGRA